MLKITKTEIYGLKMAVYGMRLPLRSHHKMDTTSDELLGPNDLDLALRLKKGGSEHRKFLRQIPVNLIIEAPQYLLRELDTYKVSTTTNSSSQMHMIMKRPLEVKDFSEENTKGNLFKTIIDYCNELIVLWNNEKEKEKKEDIFRELIQTLPQSYNYERLFTCNLEVLYNMYQQRKTHKLKEWRDFCTFLETIPLFRQLFINN